MPKNFKSLFFLNPHLYRVGQKEPLCADNQGIEPCLWRQPYLLSLRLCFESFLTSASKCQYVKYLFERLPVLSGARTFNSCGE
jgi:hypothetical protein